MAQRSRSPETLQSLQRRNFAVEVLQSYEKLSWFSAQRCESLVQTRLHFLNIIAGLGHYEEALVDWKQDYTPNRKPDSPKQSRKGKERVSSGNSKAKSNPDTNDSTKPSAVEPAPKNTWEQPPEPIEID